MLKRQRTPTNDHLLLSDSETGSNDSKELLVPPTKICMETEISSKIAAKVDVDKKDNNRIEKFKEMLKRAKEYQDKMKEIPIPSNGGKPEQTTGAPILTWEGVGASLRQKHEQPLHYLTRCVLAKWDSWKTAPLDPSDAVSVVWGIEQVHRKCASSVFLAKMWFTDPSYLEFVDLP
ncbi:unnamed protein product [Linum trigynum]|uniref:Uncharacterized protein n=1 Tax=Linum trigynum TaxID=586398 RepID=A0AAV2DRE9_9ROSI